MRVPLPAAKTMAESPGVRVVMAPFRTLPKPLREKTSRCRTRTGSHARYPPLLPFSDRVKDGRFSFRGLVSVSRRRLAVALHRHAALRSFEHGLPPRAR